MNSNDGGAELRLVVPGDQIDAPPGTQPGSGVCKRGDSLVATKLGELKIGGDVAHVIPNFTKYLPRSGDLVIGYVEAVMNNLWFLDVGGPFNALLPMSLAPWKVEFGAAREHMGYGDAVLARVMEVDETHSVVATMKGVGLRKIKEGVIFEMPPHLMGLVIGSNGRTLQRLKAASDCRIINTQNGRILIDGNSKGIAIARKALQMIEETGHAPGLHSRLNGILGDDE